MDVTDLSDEAFARRGALKRASIMKAEPFDNLYEVKREMAEEEGRA